MKQNIGTISALIRITLGLILFGCSTAKLVRKLGALGLKFCYGLVP
ncbi:hypothetical protein ER45_001750 [Bacillus mycoides]|nr:hypothetical protein ER45_001750 [Bacillus mycoides]